MKSENAVKFTEGCVEGFEYQPCTAGYTLYWDEKQSGLAVRVTKAGARAYVFETRVHRKTVRYTIGDAGRNAWKLDDARKEARRLKGNADRGINPHDEKRAQAAQADAARVEAERHDLVFEGVWRAYIDASTPEWGARHLANHEALAHKGGEKKKKRGGKGLTKPGPLASLLPLKLSELTSDRVAAWLTREKRTRPTSTAQGFRALQAFVNWCHEAKDDKGNHAYRGIIAADACTARTVRKLVPASRTKAGDCLQREHLPAWFREVRRISNPIIATYVQGLVLIGPRRNELAELKWADVEFKWGGSMTLHDKNESKGGEDGERTIPLPPYLASLIAALPRVNEWVFSSSESESGHIEEPTKAHRLALARAGLPRVSLHGLRRSFGTLSEWVEIPTGVVAQIQGHKPSAVQEKHYKRRPLDLLRMWHEKLEAWILEQAGVPFTRPGEKAKLGVVGADGSVQPASVA